jgi:hypothetical protein
MGQCSLAQLGGSPPVRSDYDCEHHCGRELGFDGRANPGEPLLNAVMLNKPKMLIGLDQKVSGPVQGLSSPLPQTSVPPANRRSPPHHGTDAERGKPVALPTGTADRKAC